MEPRKATHEGLKRHNRQMLLRAIYLGLANSRSSLAQMTGLTKPTVSSLVAELIEEGYVSEGGHGPASESGGKRPRLLEFRADARQIIGVSVDHEQVRGVLANLAGTVSAEHRVALDPERPLELIAGTIDGLKAQLDAPLLCIGVGLPGEVDADTGTVIRSAALGWHHLPVAAPLRESFGVPLHVAHGTELCALAQYAFGAGFDATPRRLVTLHVDRAVEVGVTLESGSFHYGGDLSELRIPSLGQGGNRELSRAVSDWGAALPRSRLTPSAGETGIANGEGSSQRGSRHDYLELRFRAAQGDESARGLLAELAVGLAPLAAWAIALLRPDHLSLEGPVAELGVEFLERLRQAAEEWLPRGDLDHTTFTLARSRQSGALGAVALALQKELALV